MILRILFLLFITPLIVKSQCLPGEGARLNYRWIEFSTPAINNAVRYKLEIASGTYFSEDSFKKNITQTFTSKSNKIIGEVPSFGRRYTWRFSGFSGKNNIKSNPGTLHHFGTGENTNTDTGFMRLRVTKAAERCKDCYVFLDGNRMLYDMKGQPVWYLPDIEDSVKTMGLLSDMRLSPKGTITLLLRDQAYEIDYNGKILWKAPNDGLVSGETSEHYHHEFTRLENGHYMVLGSEHINYERQRPQDTSLPDKASAGNIKGRPHLKTEFGTIIEYDEKGSVVWSWKSSKYFIGSDLDYYQLPVHTQIADVHENAFYFDETNKVIYVSYRNLSRILKIKYPEGTVVNVYGEIYKPGVPEQGNGLFCNQHSCRTSPGGYLYLFNNNFCNKGAPSIIMMKEPGAGNGNLKKVWEYVCPVDAGCPSLFASGGNATELPDQSMFISMGSQDSKLLIVSRDKKILWSAIPEQRNRPGGEWKMVHQYKACIITRKELEQLIENQH